MNRADLTARHSQARENEAIALASLRFLTGVQGELAAARAAARTRAPRVEPTFDVLERRTPASPRDQTWRVPGSWRAKRRSGSSRLATFPTSGWGSRRAGRKHLASPIRQSVSCTTPSTSSATAQRWCSSTSFDFLAHLCASCAGPSAARRAPCDERYALGGVAVEVETAYREAEDAQRRLDAYAEAAAYAKKWLILVQQGIDVGTNDEEDIVDPAKEWALKRFAVMSATFDYNVSRRQASSSHRLGKPGEVGEVPTAILRLARSESRSCSPSGCLALVLAYAWTRQSSPDAASSSSESASSSSELDASPAKSPRSSRS